MAGVDAVVPALNEEATVGGVVRVLVKSGVFDRVLVVDDGSTDETAQVSADEGAEVLTMPGNVGKGTAMLAGVAHCPGDVAFFDSDLVGLRPHHVYRLTAGYEAGYDMVCGLRDYGRVGSMLQTAVGPIITGERIVRRWVLERLPPSCWDGYRIETALNFVCQRDGARVCLVQLPGLSIRGKVKKGGLWSGLKGHAAMFLQMRATRRLLEESDGNACR